MRTPEFARSTDPLLNDMTDYERLGADGPKPPSHRPSRLNDYGNLRGKCLMIHLSELSAHCITAVFGGRVTQTCVGGSAPPTSP